MSVIERPQQTSVRWVSEVTAEPQTLEQTGLSFDMVLQLILKTLHFSGEVTGAELAGRLGLSHSSIQSVLEHLKLTHLVSISGGGLLGGPSFEYQSTTSGRNRALLFLEQSH